ncbi:unnamed protein product [Cyprideis torosa]|uniref:HTTM domain-containing protein n=1 Tax=Cyprideis torosa TaxID=163714 RepID=A0A7R8W7K7_9CRUS|nr:unnamed protein product [Cyprideis torosa]CAG0882536.1 unnamed protein product [Cyprideis torosa]
MKLKGVQDLFFEPVDPAWLSCFRIAFGICMFIHVPFASGLAAVDETWGLEWKCRFPLFDEAILPRPSLEGIILCYTFMWIVSFPDLWVAVNGRPFQHPIQPNLQVLEAHWSPWRRPSWVTELRGDNWIHYPQRPFPTGDKTRNSVFTQPNLYLADKGDFLRLDFLPGGEAELAKGGSVLRYLFRVLQGTIKIKDPSRVSRPPMSAHSTNVIRTKKGSILEVASETAVVSVVKEISAVEIKSRKSERKQKWHWPFVRSLLMIEGALTNALLGGWEDHVGDLEEGAGFVNLSMSWFK